MYPLFPYTTLFRSVYFLDSPEQRAELEHLLRGLHRLYDLPVTLAVMPANYGYAAANNAGAAIACGRFLALVNSDVIPTAPGWLPLLTGRQIGRASCRESVCQYVELPVVAVSLKKKKQKKP